MLGALLQRVTSYTVRRLTVGLLSGPGRTRVPGGLSLSRFSSTGETVHCVSLILRVRRLTETGRYNLESYTLMFVSDDRALKSD